jgi:hypothetical protein
VQAQRGSQDFEDLPPFRLADLKDFTARFYLLCFMQLTTNGVYWVFMAMIMQFLEVKCGVTYEQAKNMIVFVPIFAALVIFITMLVAKAIKNETKLLWLSALIGCSIMITIGTVDFSGIFSGLVILGLHSIYGAILVACYWPCLGKNVSKNLASCGNSLAVTMNDLAIAFGPLVTGMFMGEKGTVKSIDQCCLFLGIISLMGLLAATILVWTDRHHESPETCKENLKNELVASEKTPLISVDGHI